MILRSVQRPFRCINGRLPPCSRFSSAHVLRAQTAENPTSSGSYASPEVPSHAGTSPAKKPLSYYTIPCLVLGGFCLTYLLAKYERSSKQRIASIVRAIPSERPDLEPSPIIQAMIDLKEDSQKTKQFVHFACVIDTLASDSKDPGYIALYLASQIMLAQSIFTPKLDEKASEREVILFLQRGWTLLNVAADEVQDATTDELLRQAEAEIFAIRALAFKDIRALLGSKEVKQMKPIEVVKAMIEPLQRARIGIPSRVFNLVHARLKVVNERKAQEEKYRNASG